MPLKYHFQFRQLDCAAKETRTNGSGVISISEVRYDTGLVDMRFFGLLWI